MDYKEYTYLESKSVILLKEMKDYFACDDVDVLIPLLQRNYKWSAECAAELSEDLWDYYIKNKDKEEIPHYLLKLVTIYIGQEKNGRKELQIIDGQQRLITLTILFSYFNLFIAETDNVLDFRFERDNIFLDIDECGANEKRRYFIDKCLKCSSFFGCNKKCLYTDTRRIEKNYKAMILPLTVRDVLESYKDAEDEVNKKIENNELDKKQEIMEEVKGEFIGKIKSRLKTLFKIYELTEEEKEQKVKSIDNELESEDKYKSVIDRLFEQGKEMSKDSTIDLHSSDKADKCMKVILEWKCQFLSKLKPIDDIAIDFKKFIFNNVEVFSNFTHTEPIEEFLNINENKTPFVISDYIKAHLIIDTSDRGTDRLENGLRKRTRENIMDLFSSLSNFMYTGIYKDIWKLIKRGYEPEEEHKNEIGYKWEERENRLKILFCDKYVGTSIKGFDAENEFMRLQYFESVLNCLTESVNKDVPVWSVYNAVWVLYVCNQERFFKMFGTEYKNKYENYEELRKIIQKKFNFQEFVLEKLKNSDNPWHVQYFLESLLYDEKHEIENTCNMRKEELEKNNRIADNSKSGLYVSTDWIYYSEPDEILKKMVQELYKE